MIRTVVKSKLASLLMVVYNLNPKQNSATLLRLIGVAHQSWREDFATLQRIVESLSGVEGAIAECGVFRGGTLLGMAHLLRQHGMRTRCFGLDSFEGLPEPTAEDALADGSFHELALAGTFNGTSYESLQQKIKRLGFEDQIVLIKGFFENTLHNLKDETFALVHIDCDLYQPYKDCLEFFYDKVNPGGYIVFDEYDFSKTVYPGAQVAIDDFFAEKPERVECFEGLRYPRYFVRKQ